MVCAAKLIAPLDLSRVCEGGHACVKSQMKGHRPAHPRQAQRQPQTADGFLVQALQNSASRNSVNVATSASVAKAGLGFDGFDEQRVGLAGGAVVVEIEAVTVEVGNARLGGGAGTAIGEATLREQGRQRNPVIHPFVGFAGFAEFRHSRRRWGLCRAARRAEQAGNERRRGKRRTSQPQRWTTKSSSGMGRRIQDLSISPPLDSRTSWSRSSMVIHSWRRAADASPESAPSRFFR